MTGRSRAGRRRRSLLACLLLLGAAGHLRGEEAATTTVRTGPHFEVTCHFRSDLAAEQSLRILEALWPLAEDLYGLPPGPVEPPLPVHVYRDPAAYEEVEARLIGGRLRRNLAFVHWDSRSAHVALQPRVDDAVLGRFGATVLTLELVAHEGAHLARMHAYPDIHRDHPDWFVDGAGVWLSAQVLTRTGTISGALLHPSTAVDVLHAQRLLAEGLLPDAASILEDAPSVEALDFYERYAVRGAFFDFLATGPEGKPLRRALRRMRDAPPGKALAEHWRSVVDAEFREGSASLDTRFRTRLRAATPSWNEVFRALETDGLDWLQTAFDEGNAIAWRTEPVGRLPYRFEAEVELLAGDPPQANVLLDRSKAGFVSVALTAGHVDVFEYHTDEDRWDRLGAASAPALAVGRPVRVVVEVGPGRLAVGVAGRPALALEIEGRSLRGPWGLGVQAGSAVLWRRVRVEPGR